MSEIKEPNTILLTEEEMTMKIENTKTKINTMILELEKETNSKIIIKLNEMINQVELYSFRIVG